MCAHTHTRTLTEAVPRDSRSQGLPAPPHRLLSPLPTRRTRPAGGTDSTWAWTGCSGSGVCPASDHRPQALLSPSDWLPLTLQFQETGGKDLAPDPILLGPRTLSPPPPAFPQTCPAGISRDLPAPSHPAGAWALGLLSRCVVGRPLYHLTITPHCGQWQRKGN